MSKMGEIVYEVMEDLSDGNLTRMEIAAKYNIPLDWVRAIAQDMVSDNVGVDYDDKPF